jgi:hypothetical protein
MSTTTFSGPVRAGTQKDGNIAQGFNLGNVVLSQTFDTGNITGRVVGTVNTQIGILPAGAIITDIAIDQVVASATGTTTVAVGNASGGAQLMAAVATTAGGRFRGTATAATQLAWQTGTTADTAIWLNDVTGTATLTAGRYVVTVSYIQK